MLQQNNRIEEHATDYSPRASIAFTGGKWPAALGFITFTVLAALTGILTYQRWVINEENVQKDTLDFIVSAKEKLLETLSQGISATKTMSFFIGKDGSVKDFDSVAAQILNANKDIDVLQLVPGGVIKYVYPLKENEKVIGYDVLKDPTRSKEAQKAIIKRQLFYAGPVALKQGDMGVIGRLPVFRNNKFWGFSAVVIKLSTLFKAAGIDSTGKSGYYFKFSKIDPATNQEQFFTAQPQKFVADNYLSVHISTGDWKLSAVPVNEYKGYGNIILLAVLGFLFAFMGSIFVFSVAKKPGQLDELVKKRTSALQESEEKYRSLIEQASDGIVVTGFDGKIDQFNKIAYTETGYTREEFAQLNLIDLFVEKKVIIDQSRADELLAGNKISIERQLSKKDGSVMDIEINVSLMADGKLLAFIRNTTVRRNIERALKESEEKFSKAFQTNLLAFAIYDEHYQLLEANRRYTVIMNAALDNTTKKNNEAAGVLNNANLPEVNEIRVAINQALADKGRLENYEIQFENNNGKVTCLLLSIVPLELNNKINWLHTAIDITEKKIAAIRLAQNELKYRSLIEQASDGIIISDFAGIIVEVNKSICTMGGYRVDEMIGVHIDHFMPKEDITGNPLRIKDLLEGEALVYERRMQKKDGTVIDVEINSKMAFGNTLIGFVRDITKRKKSEADLKSANERFELTARATNDAIWDHDFVKNETDGNENLYNLCGITKDAGAKMSFEIFMSRLHPDDRGRVAENIEIAIREKATQQTDEFRFKIKDGSYKYFYSRAYLTYTDNGLPLRMVGAIQDITGRIKDQEKLQKEKELSDSVINSLPAVFYVHNNEGKFLRWNKNFEAVTGYTGEEIAGMQPLDIFTEEQRPLMQEKINSVFASGHDTVEAFLLLKNNQEIPYYFSGKKIDYEGEICLMGFGLDFSAKVRSQKLLKESEQKFRSLVEQASDGILILSEQGVPLYSSPSIERILGYSEVEMMNLNVNELTHADESAAIAKVFNEVMQNPGIPIKGHISRVLHKDGSWRFFEDTITNLIHVPAIGGIVENLRDITEKLQIEKSIIAEKELSDSVINSLPGIFYLYDATGKFIRWNKNLETVTGYSPEEIIEMKTFDLFADEDRPMVVQRMNDVFTRKMPHVEFYLVTKDRKKIPFFYNSIAINYEGQASIVTMGFDVTERKKIEQQLLVSNQQLGLKAHELTASYTELERFAYIVSHDLQEPLRMVSSFLKLLEQKYKGQLDETAEKYIFFAVDGALRMKQLIMDLLEYSRTGTNKDVPTDTDMNEVMVGVIDLLDNSIREQKAVVEFAHLPVLAGTNKIQMFQLMQNLLSNALKYHGEKKPVIKIDATESAGQWVFSMADNGIGIDSKFADKIFVVFQRLHNKNEFSGTGIGLSICKKIVEKHGGKIWMESSPGNGSTFYFNIPKNNDYLTEAD